MSGANGADDNTGARGRVGWTIGSHEEERRSFLPERFSVNIEVVLADPRLSKTLAGKIEDVTARTTIRELMIKFLRTKENLDEHGINRNDPLWDLRLLTVYGESLAPEVTLGEAGVRDGDTLYLGNHESESTLFSFHNWYLISFLTLIIGGGGLISVLAIFTSVQRAPFVNGFVMDIGSSHAEIYLYRWAGDKRNGTGLVEEVGTSCRIVGSAAALPPTREAVRNFLTPCFDPLKRKLAPKDLAETPIHIRATAGFRLLYEMNPDRASYLLSEIDSVFRSEGFNVDPEATILTGLDEGLDGWVTLNYLHNTLRIPEKFSPTYRPHTVGSLDIGGASLELTYQTMNWSDATQVIHLYGYHVPLFSQSYLCYGLGEAERRLLAMLARDTLATMPLVETTTNGVSVITVSNPCGNISAFPQTNGTVSPAPPTSRSWQDLFESPCTETLAPPKPANASVIVFNFEYHFNLTDCQTRIKEFIDADSCQALMQGHHCMPSRDILPARANIEDGKVEPVLTTTFHILSDIMRQLQLKPEGNDLTDFESRLKAICEMTWMELEKDMGLANVTDLSKLPDLCFEGWFIHDFLTDFVGLRDPMDWKKLTFAEKFGTEDLSWTLGFMINATNAIPERNPSPLLTTAMFVLLLILFFGFLVTGSAFLTHALRISRIRRAASFILRNQERHGSQRLLTELQSGSPRDPPAASYGTI